MLDPRSSNLFSLVDGLFGTNPNDVSVGQCNVNVAPHIFHSSATSQRPVRAVHPPDHERDPPDQRSALVGGEKQRIGTQ
jgi:hypothetical protein